MAEWLGVLLALVAVVAPLIVAWWLLGRAAGSRAHDRPRRDRE